ncbi:MAG: ABC-2 transporter permease [Christensenellales bacterium]|jgi:hypothetical protein
MLNLLRKEWLVSRWVHIIALLVGLGIVFIAKAEPKSALFAALFANLMYTHMVFNMTRALAVSRPSNMLLNSLPVTRTQIIAAKYLFAVMCVVLFALYTSLLLVLAAAWGVPLGMPVWLLWLLPTILGLLYLALLMPLSYLDAKYGAWASMAIYLAILILPRRLGKGKTGEALTAFFARIASLLGNGGILAALVLGIALLVGASMLISMRIYRRAEF